MCNSQTNTTINQEKMFYFYIFLFKALELKLPKLFLCPPVKNLKAGNNKSRYIWHLTQGSATPPKYTNVLGTHAYQVCSEACSVLTP